MTTMPLDLPFIYEDPYLRAVRAEEDYNAYKHKLRKAMFARLGEERKKLIELENRLTIIESGICQGKVEFKEQ